VVAIRQGKQVVVSWRTLTSDAVGQAFDVYRNGQKLNSQPLCQGGTFYIDEAPLAGGATYEVRGGGKNGSYQLRADAPEGYLSVKLQKPADGITPDGRTFSYTANDASVGDVDGDGQYEIVLKWDPTNAHDNAHDGYTGPTLLDCYRLDGTLLWRIDLGINIRSGAHYTPYIFYDLDGDGRAELMVRTSDGTRDGIGHVIGDAKADYRHGLPAVAENPKPEREWGKYNKQGRPMTGRILTGNEYITVFDGLTGKALDTKPYVPARGNLSDWGDNYANRSDRMLAGVGYLDGKHASAIFCRGYYTRTVLAAWDWNGKELKQHWVFDTNNEGVGKDGKPLRSYAGQGNHNLRVADVDGDGCDEIIYGSMAVDHDGSGLYNTGMGHGDALHLMAFDPKSDELQIWDCHENRKDGSDFRNARTGEVIFQIPSTKDVGRCMAADIDPTNPGLEMWSTDSHGIRNMKGEVIYTAEDPDDPQHKQHLKLGGRHLSVNFGIWWDGDLLRELLDHETVSKYDWHNHTIKDVTKFEGVVFNNGTKSNPCLSADILGDWREEVIARTPDSSELRIFVSTIPTQYRINCLMEDIPYRLSTAAQNVGYNQPSEPGFYLGSDNFNFLR
jgi:rhamnogalacturonan endolyase